MNDKRYINWIAMSDAALVQTIGAFVKHHRLSQKKRRKRLQAQQK